MNNPVQICVETDHYFITGDELHLKEGLQGFLDSEVLVAVTEDGEGFMVTVPKEKAEDVSRFLAEKGYKPYPSLSWELNKLPSLL